MRFLFFPNLDHINNNINGRITATHRYTCKFSVFSLKATKEQKTTRQQLIKKINERVSNMKKMGISTQTAFDDLAKPQVRKLYCILISILNVVYSDYDFSNSSFDNFIPTTCQQCVDQIYNDCLLPLENYDNNAVFSFSKQPINAEDTTTASSSKYQLLMSLREAIGFDLQLPTKDGTSSGNCYIFEYDNDGDGPLHPESRLWTKVYLCYNPILKRAALLTLGCKSTQTLYSPAILPQMAHKYKDDDFDFSLDSASNKRNIHSTTTANNGIADNHDGEDGDNGDSDLEGVVLFSDSEGDDDSDDDHPFDDSATNNIGPRKNQSVVQRLLSLDETASDDDEQNSRNQNVFNNFIQVTRGIGAVNNDPNMRDDRGSIGGGSHNTANNANKDRSSIDNKSLYSYENTNAYGSTIYTTRNMTNNDTLSSHGSSNLSYTNHVELVEKDDGEIEIVPLLLEPRQLNQLKRQQEQDDNMDYRVTKVQTPKLDVQKSGQ